MHSDAATRVTRAYAEWNMHCRWAWESQRFESLWDEITFYWHHELTQSDTISRSLNSAERSTVRKFRSRCQDSKESGDAFNCFAANRPVTPSQTVAAWRRSLTPDVAKGQPDKRREIGGLNGGKLSTLTDCDSSPQKVMAHLPFLSMTVMIC